MQYNELGRTGIEVSRICLGTMTWGEQNTQAQAHEQLDYALSQGATAAIICLTSSGVSMENPLGGLVRMRGVYYNGLRRGALRQTGAMVQQYSV